MWMVIMDNQQKRHVQIRALVAMGTKVRTPGHVVD